MILSIANTNNEFAKLAQKGDEQGSKPYIGVVRVNFD